MNKYITKSGQNIYDVALTIYGSIEGIFDLLLSNSNISLNTILSKNTELIYHEDFTINKNIVNWLKDNNVTVKNGNYKIKNIDIKSEIIEWLNKTNSQKFTLNTDSNDTLSTIKPGLWLDDSNTGSKPFSEQSVNKIPLPSDSFIPSQKWTGQIVTDNVINKWATSEIKSDITLDLSKLNADQRKLLLNEWYSKGLIVLPSNKDELEYYYDNVSTPKIRIEQIGNTSAINMQIPANNFIAIDWGDFSGVEFYHYQKDTISITHTYNDSDRHSIFIYGNNKFTNLDFTNINGIYYALTHIYISGQFVTPYKEMTSLNKLFIIQSK